jgi:putative ABC transport system ATP-binding protein
VTAAAGADPPDIELTAAGYTYPGPPPVQALKPADLVIERGEHVSIMGPSGSGKSTLLNLLGLLDRPTEGSLRIDGIDLGRAAERDRAAVRARRIGFVFQSFHLLPHRSAVENVMLAQVYADLPRRRRYAAAMSGLPTSAWPAGRTRCPPSCRAASGSEWRSRGRWSTGRRCCCATSRPATWTRRPPPS